MDDAVDGIPDAGAVLDDGVSAEVPGGFGDIRTEFLAQWQTLSSN